MAKKHKPKAKHSGSNHRPHSAPKGRAASTTRTYSILDYRLEKPSFHLRQVRDGDTVRYEVTGTLDGAVPPIRDSKYLSKQQCIEIYRWMLLNRKMEAALENLYKQGKVVGGVYFGLGQEACSCASAYALVAPISTLGDLIPVLAGVALGARLQGKNIAVMTYIGDGGQSTGVTYEGLNFAAVQNLGLVLFVENNLWGYSTPADMQFRVEDLAERAIAYGIPGVIADGTDACQIYDAAHEACERARRGEGPTLIEAKMMRMKGHAIHDAAEYVPKPLFEYWKKRDPIARFDNYLVNVKKWLTRAEHEKLVAEVDAQLEADREFAVASPMPKPETAAGGTCCEPGCHDIKPKYGVPKVRTEKVSSARRAQAALHLK